MFQDLSHLTSVRKPIDDIKAYTKSENDTTAITKPVGDTNAYTKPEDDTNVSTNFQPLVTCNLAQV